MPRLPELFDRDALPEEHRHVHDYLLKTRGAVSNGFAPLLHSPEFVQRVAHLGTFVRFESSLPVKMRELTAFATSTELGNRYEQAIHGRDAVTQGVSEAALAAVRSGGPLEGLSEEEAVPLRCVRELLHDHGLSDATFNAAHALLGSQGAVELIGTIGYYAMVACLHTGMGVEPPAPQ